MVVQVAKNLPAVQETWVQSLGWEDPLEKHIPMCNVGTWVRSLGWEGPLEKGMATHSSILAWRIPKTEDPGGL